MPPPGRRLGESHRLKKPRTLKKTDLPSSLPTPFETSLEAIEAILRKILSDPAWQDFLIFSPDELSSNRLAGLLGVTSLRHGCNVPERPPFCENGRIVEILNEHLCFAWLHGHTAAGGRGVFVTYEAFAPLLNSLVAQELAFLKGTADTSWRESRPSLNLVLTSLGWHNTPTHHNPGFADALLGRALEHVRVFTPAHPMDAAHQFSVMLTDSGSINVMSVSKHPLPRVLACERTECIGAAWNRLAGGQRDQAFLIAVGDCMAEECLAAREILMAKGVRKVAVIALNEVSALERPNDVSLSEILSMLEGARASVWVYNGYPKTLRSMLYGRANPAWPILGYSDCVQTPSGDERLQANGVDRHSIVAAITLQLAAN